MKIITKYFCLIVAGISLIRSQETSSSLSKIDRIFIEGALKSGHKGILPTFSDNALKALDEKKQSYLHKAAKSNAPNASDIINYLVKERKLDIHQKDEKGNKPIMKASTVKILKTFLELDNASTLTQETTPYCELISTTNNEGKSLLHKAVQKDNIEAIKYLLTHGLKKWVNKKTTIGETPLYFVYYTGSLNATKLLIEAGAEIDEKNIAELTPFTALAIETGQKESEENFKERIETLSFLLKHGANINNTCLIRNVESGEIGRHSLISLVPFGEKNSKNLIKFLITHNANSNCPQVFSKALVYAQKYNKISVLKLLIKNGADWSTLINEEPFLNYLRLTLERDRKIFSTLLPLFFLQITGHKITLPFKELPSKTILEALRAILVQGKILPQKQTNPLENLCLKFFIAFGKGTSEEDLKCTPTEKSLCTQYFTIDPLGFRDTILWQQQQQKDMNNMVGSQAKQTSRFKKEFLHDLKINFNA